MTADGSTAADDGPAGSAAVAMFETGWFGRGAAFWRWVETPEARPYVEAFVAHQQQPDDDDPFNRTEEHDAPGLLDPDHLSELAREIASRYRKEGDYQLT